MSRHKRAVRTRLALLRNALPALLDAAEECERLRDSVEMHKRMMHIKTGVLIKTQKDRDAAIARAEAAERRVAEVEAVLRFVEERFGPDGESALDRYEGFRDTACPNRAGGMADAAAALRARKDKK